MSARFKTLLDRVAKHHDWLLMDVLYGYLGRAYIVLLILVGIVALVFEITGVSSETRQVVKTVFLTICFGGIAILLVCVPIVGFLEWRDTHKRKEQHC